MDALYKTLVVKEVSEEVSGFKTIVFEDGHGIRYKPGQFLTLSLSVHSEEVRRSYSITSTPVLNEPLTIGVKRVDNGLVSRWLTDHIFPGAGIRTTGAGGFFTLPYDLTPFRRILFFAAGSGITPVYSLIKTLLHLHSIEVVLIYSSASVEKTVFYNQLNDLRNASPGKFQIRYFFSNHPKLAEARLHRDSIFSILQNYSEGITDKTLFYICGPESYMRLCQFTLSEAGVSREFIRMENFVSPLLKKLKADPPDKNPHTVYLRAGEKEYSFSQHFPETILAAAKKNKINLPYSCETGKCGNCVAKCVSGEVWHSNNEVLTDKELLKGLILTCVGYPVGGDVRLEI